MTDSPLWILPSARIRQLDRVLERDPEAIEARSERAGLLREQGRYEEAKRDYVELIRRRPTDFGVLNDFGTLVLKAGYKEAARSLFGEAVRHHPNNPMGHVNLANLLFLIGEWEKARRHFEAALRIDPAHIHAHRGMGNVLAEIGDTAGARRHRDRAFKSHFLTTLPYRGDGPAVPILLLISAMGGNIPTDHIIDDHYFQTTVLVAEYDDPGLPLPPHALVVNSIGDADLCGSGLEAACSVLSRTDKPVINHPRTVLKTGRASNVERLRGLPNVVVPRIATLPRRALANSDVPAVMASCGFCFPVLLRSPGFHTGRHFIRVEDAQSLMAAATALPGDDVWLIEPLDARDGEGLFRKFRVMIVDRKIYPLHLAISHNWKVHYFTADMAHSAENRAQDEAFVRDMARVVGQSGVTALGRICAALDLDYGGIDFAVNAQGEILFFEANATMVMLPLLPDQMWDYRRPAYDQVFTAVHRMLVERAGNGGSLPLETAPRSASR